MARSAREQRGGRVRVRELHHHPVEAAGAALDAARSGADFVMHAAEVA